MMEAILNNLVLKITNIEVTYENDLSQSPFILGMSLVNHDFILYSEEI